AMRAHMEGLFGVRQAARNDAKRAMGLAHGRDVLSVSAWSLALAGDIPRALAAEQELMRRYPTDTIARNVYLPALRASFNSAGGQAIEGLRAALPYELASSPGTIPMYAVYVRGGAYLRAHQGQAAALEFQKILDHPGVVTNSPVGALAHLGLA